MTLKIVATIMLAVSLSACSVLPKPAAAPKRHDLGVEHVTAPASSPGKVRITGIGAASWLNGTTIYYRKLDADPTRLRSYALNQWLTPPAELIATRLGDAFEMSSAQTSRSSSYQLALHLEALEQVFPDSQHAYVLLRIKATLNGGALSAGKIFKVKQQTRPDVTGAVKGTANAVDQLYTRLLRWLRIQAAHRHTQ